ncbi:MAG: tRNA (guanine37-N1)-methyltransferase [Caldanaerobacter sp.]|uniref:tRNA (guanosine(37)-N1)-methyltransferase TrmD n=1 Tax=Caldanaerobacter sp. TaxID=2930036 RepID=UPI0024AA2937|nr:tRNA (guanosine(37)-N1)-methyltransferase TrmD [Caldanaerobacter sp.]MDI3518332.1 tRNA (guanine37-N1)-methyltransferase [Caldanaerobacter sp.]MDK2794097.1 tRNA (guanine37-N1)-methyltransferase [Caldanaerobacter sp.]
MIFDVLTLFPEMFECVLSHSILKRAVEKGKLKVNLINIRDFSKDKHKRVDDYPYGGGPGMVMMPQPLFDAIEFVKSQGNIPVYYLSPKGKIFTQEMARELSKMKRIALLCGHYEGIDERVYAVIDGEISIGDFILTGGELAAMVVIDAVTRLIDGVLSHPQSALEESFSDYLLEYPQYTRPEVFRGMRVPEVLLSGNHAEIARWRRQKSLEITLLKRPDLLKKANLTEEDKKFLREKGYEI